MSKLILLTGGKRSGKDTFAQLAQEIAPGRVHQTAIADWFKRVLAHVTEQDLGAFYDDRKDQAYQSQVMTLGQRDILKLGLTVATVLKGLGLDYNHDKLYGTLQEYKGRTFVSNRKLMEWFGFEWVHKCFGSDEIHCLVTMRTLQATLREAKAVPDYVIITDARTHYESSWFSIRWPGDSAIAVKNNNPAVVQGSSDVEKATNLFPEGWFDHVLDNPYPNLAMYRTLVQKVLVSK